MKMRSSGGLFFLISTCGALVKLSLAVQVLSAGTPNEQLSVVSNQRADDIKEIKSYVLNGAGRHSAFDRLAFISDSFGSRMSGSQGLEDATDYAVKMLREEGFDVHTENVSVPKWVRGTERAELRVNGHVTPLKILGLGTSVGTPGITAGFIVVQSFEELDVVKESVRGRIVVYNEPYMGYGPSVAYRVGGAERASQYGAVAALVRSVTPFSIDSPHTGMQNYGAAQKIPVASITVEDAEMLQRWQNRVKCINNATIYLYMEARNVGEFIQRNVVAEIKGSLHPEQTVIVGGHYDSWDVGTGSMDDGGGAIIAWQEQGIIGGQEYFNRHKNDKNNVSFVMESDMGAFKPIGLKFTGSKAAAVIIQDIIDELADLNITQLELGDGGSSDTDMWVSAGVPGAELLSHNENYFDFHHSNGDRMTVMNADHLDLCSILWAVTTHVIANLPDLLPR